MQPVGRVSEDEYLARERLAPEKSELVNGVVLAMAGASKRHNALVRNLLRALGNRLDGKPCQPYASDLRIMVPATGLYTYPDVTVICGPPISHRKDAETYVNPTLIVEVLSDKTEAFDRGAKFAHYRSIPSLQTYVLVAQDEVRVEWFEREEGKFTFRDATAGGTVELPSVGVSLAVDELYVNLPD